MFSLKNLFKTKALTLVLTRAQRELLELLLHNKTDFEEWATNQGNRKIRFQFFYPAAVDFYFDEFKLFTAFFKKDAKGEVKLNEFKMSETNYDTIRCQSWAPFEEVIIAFLTSLEETKKIALFEKRKALFEYQSLCTKNIDTTNAEQAYAGASTSSLPFLNPTR